MAKEELEKYFNLLGVKPGTPWEEIKRSYRDLVKVWHPDRFTNDTRLRKLAEEKTKEINFAFKKLEEDNLSIKFSYDDFGKSPETATKPSEKPAHEQKIKPGKKKTSVADIKRQAEELLKKAQTVPGENYRSVVNYLDQAIELDPFLEEAYVARGMAHIELKEFSLAIEDFNEAIKLNNKLFECFRGRATAQFELGNYSLSVKDFSTAIDMEPSAYPALYYYRGKAYEIMGLMAEAAIDLKRNERLIKSSQDDGSDKNDAAAQKSHRSYWLTHVAFGLVLCLIFIVLYLSYEYISKRANEKTRATNTPVVQATPIKEIPVDTRSIGEFMKDKYNSLLKSRTPERKTGSAESESKAPTSGVVKVESASDIKQESPKPDRVEKEPQTDTLQKDQNKSQESERKSVQNQKNTFDQWRKIKELEKSFPSFLER